MARPSPVPPILRERPLSGATHLARATLVHTIEALEEALQVFGSHPHSIVGKAEMPLAVVLYVGLDKLCRERYGGTYAGVCYGVVREIAEDAVDKAAVAADDEVGRQAVYEGHVLFL